MTSNIDKLLAQNTSELRDFIHDSEPVVFEELDSAAQEKINAAIALIDEAVYLVDDKDVDTLLKAATIILRRA